MAAELLRCSLVTLALVVALGQILLCDDGAHHHEFEMVYGEEKMTIWDWSPTLHHVTEPNATQIGSLHGLCGGCDLDYAALTFAKYQRWF